MSQNSKYHDEQFSMRSLESAYLPHMFSEIELPNDDEVGDSIESTSSKQVTRTKNSANVSFIDLQSPSSLQSHRIEPYLVDTNGILTIIFQIRESKFNGYFRDYLK